MNKTLFEVLVIDFTIKWAFGAITLLFLKTNRKKNPDPFFSLTPPTDRVHLLTWNMMNNIHSGKGIKTAIEIRNAYKRVYFMDFFFIQTIFWQMEMYLRRGTFSGKISSCFNIHTIKWYNIYTIFLSSDFAWEFRLNFEAIGANEQNWRRKSKRARAGKTNSFDLRDIEKKQEWNEFPEKLKHSKNFQQI